MTTDEQDIRTACATFGRAMSAMDLRMLKHLWDDSFEHLVYQPEEYETACRSWQQIVDYWTHIPDAVEQIREWRELDIDITVLGDVALVYTVVATSFQLKGLDEPLDGDVRFTFALRRTPNGWRFVHCHESRQLDVPA